MAAKKYPLGIQTFSEIAKGNYYYADKTDVVYRLVHYAKYHFLSRPRRFGKSLFVSTLQAYFEGKKELFKGLAIEQLEQEWTEYPVIHLDLSGGKYYSIENLHDILNMILLRQEEKYGIKTDKSQAYSARLTQILETAIQKTGKQVVVLIDEYDSPMHDSMKDKVLQDKIRNIMRDFFSPLKEQEKNLRFVLITGISKFSQLSIFSELNNIKNISMKDEYSDICGITKEQLLTDFRDGIEAMAAHNSLTFNETVEKLKEHYDGYHFTPNSPDIFNPYSIINALDDRDFNSYWFTSGTPTFLIELLQKNGIDMLQLNNLWARDNRFDVPTDSITDPIPVLYQSGYLTIKEYNHKLRMYRLGFPNEEVRQGFSESLYRYYAPTMMGELDSVVYKYREKVLLEDDIKAFLPYLQTFYDKFPYTIINNNERHYQAVMFTIFSMLGADVKVEEPTPDGRIDMVLKTDTTIYVFELKYNKSADVAIQQIKQKDYAKIYAGDGRKIVKVGLNFSEDRRSLENWKVED
nr:ATP-binding protein [Prevotella sp.]